MDTEFESARGGTTLSLIQIHDGKEVHLVDALRLPSLAALGPALSGAEQEWVLHAGQQDVPLLMDHLGLENLPRLLDTQVAWACCSPEASVSLAYLEMVLLGKRRGKGHQADDWKRRPLPRSQLAYAAEDVASLPALFEQLEGRLKENDRVEIAYQASRELLQPQVEPPRRLRLADFRNAWQLGPGQQARLASPDRLVRQAAGQKSTTRPRNEDPALDRGKTATQRTGSGSHQRGLAAIRRTRGRATVCGPYSARRMRPKPRASSPSPHRPTRPSRRSEGKVGWLEPARNYAPNSRSPRSCCYRRGSRSP